MSQTPDEDFGPILPGDAASDYERYLRTDELLSLQKPAEDQIHPDELLFQTVHQSSELWLKFGCAEVEQACELIDAEDLPEAARLLRRAVRCLIYVTDALEMLSELDPWDYDLIRMALGHGSGFDSPGFRQVARVSMRAGAAFDRALERERIDLIELYRARRDPPGALRRRRAPDRLGRADLRLAPPPLQRRHPRDRRGDDRHPGPARRGPDQADEPAPVAPPLGGALPAGRAVRGRAGRVGGATRRGTRRREARPAGARPPPCRTWKIRRPPRGFPRIARPPCRTWKIRSPPRAPNQTQKIPISRPDFLRTYHQRYR